MPEFRTTILTAGKTATGIQVPEEVVAALGSSRKPAVKVTINGYTYRSTVATMDGRFMVGVNSDVRQAAGVGGGDEVDVVMELDTEPREVAVPDDLAAALAGDPRAKAFFDGLSFSKKRAIAEPIGALKTLETRQKRIATVVARLRDGKT
jgi:hypothetical protein